MILLAAPSALEASFYFEHLESFEKLNLPFKAYKGLIGKQKIILAEIGIGKIQAAINTYKILHEFEIKQIIAIGVAGINSEFGQIGDICLVTQSINADIGYLFDEGKRQALNFPIQNLVLNTNKKLLNEILEFSKNFSWPQIPDLIKQHNRLYGKIFVQNKIIKGICASGDLFFHGLKACKEVEQRITELTNENYLLTEMEGHAILSAVQQFGIPTVIIKGASNFDRSWNENISALESLQISLKSGGIQYAAQVSAKFVLDWLKVI